MEFTLVYNGKPDAGDPTCDALLEALTESGLRAAGPPSVGKKDLEGVLDDAAPLVVVAGGDGTVGTVARRLAGSERVLAILPCGTANNLARSLGIPLDPLAAARDLRQRRDRRLDVGVVQFDGHRERFIEAVGVGVFPHLMHLRTDDSQKRLDRALGLLLDEVRVHPARETTVVLDGSELSSSFVLLEAMNFPMIGPNVRLAPDAQPDDGLLDVALVTEDDRAALAQWLAERLQGRAPRQVPWRVVRAREVRLSPGGLALHVDDEVRCVSDSATSHDAQVTISLEPRALRVVVPA
jgi:diacylglycerol kinase (ATP)